MSNTMWQGDTFLFQPFSSFFSTNANKTPPGRGLFTPCRPALVSCQSNVRGCLPPQRSTGRFSSAHCFFLLLPFNDIELQRNDQEIICVCVCGVCVCFSLVWAVQVWRHWSQVWCRWWQEVSPLYMTDDGQQVVSHKNCSFLWRTRIHRKPSGSHYHHYWRACVCVCGAWYWLSAVMWASVGGGSSVWGRAVVVVVGGRTVRSADAFYASLLFHPLDL